MAKVDRMFEGGGAPSGIGRAVGRVRNTKTSANRNIKLETKMSKTGTPPGYKWGMGSKTKGGKETLIVASTGKGSSVGNAAKIKGPLRNTKENTVKAIAKVENKPYISPAADKQRIISGLMKNPSKPIPKWVSNTQRAKIEAARGPKTLKRNK